MKENSVWKNAIHTITQEDCKNLTPGTQYDLSGFVNSEVKMHLRNHGNSNAVFFRVPVITYDQMHFVVDILRKIDIGGDNNGYGFNKQCC